MCARVYGGCGNAKHAETIGLDLNALMIGSSKANNTMCFYLDCVNLVSVTSEPSISSCHLIGETLVFVIKSIYNMCAHRKFKFNGPVGYVMF